MTELFHKIQNNNYLPFLLIFIVIIIVYSQAIYFGFTSLDDQSIILDNYNVIGNITDIDKAFTSDAFIQKRGDAFYRPFQTVTYMFDAFLGGKDPWIYHLTNVILHIITCSLLYNLLKLLFSSSIYNFPLVLLFCIHPLFTHAVSWIPSRGDLLVGALGILSFISFINFVNKRLWYHLLLHFASFLLALFSKEIAILFPLVYIYYYFFLARTVNNKQPIYLSAIVWLLCIMGFLFLRNQVIVSSIPSDVFGLIPLTKNYAILFIIIGKTFLPIKLSTMPSIDTFSIVVGILCVSVCVLYLIFNGRPTRSNVYLGALWYFIFITPTLLYRHPLADVSYQFFEHRAYLPCVGILIILSQIAAQSIKINVKSTFWAVYLILLILFSGATLIQSKNYKDSYTFYLSAIEANPNNAMAYNNLGNIKSTTGDVYGAMTDFTKAISIKYDYADAYYNRGTLKSVSRLYKEALQDLDRAIHLDSTYANAYYNRSIVKGKLADYKGALEDCNKAIRNNPDFYSAFYQRGNIHADLGNYEQAIKDYVTAIYYEPNYAEAYNNRANILCLTNKYQAAIDDCNKALEIRPAYAEAYYNRGVARYNLNNYKSAIEDLTFAILYREDYVDAYYYRGIIRLKTDDKKGACEDFKILINLGYSKAEELVNKNCPH